MNCHIFVVCAYRESPYLEACIRSLAGQEAPADKNEIILATSTPNAYITGLGEKYGIPVRVGTGGSIAADWNHALACGRAAGADYVTLAHQDDVYEPGYREAVLSAAAEAVRQGENPQIVFTDYYEIREEITGAVQSGRNGCGTQENETRSRIREDDLAVSESSLTEVRQDSNRNLAIKRRLLAPLKNRGLRRISFGKRCAIRFGNAICCPAVTYVIRNIPENPFRDNMGSNIDWQLWEELSRQKGSFLYLPEKLMGHRIHEGSTTSELIADSERAGEDEYMLRKFWPGWMAHIIARPYRQAEKSNRV